MCIAVFIWKAHPLYPLLLLLNRDEYHNRATKPLAWWEGDRILAGRDEVAGGTWLGCTRSGRVAFLTNVRELQSLPQSISRGRLPLRFLEAERLRDSFRDLLEVYGEREAPAEEMVETLMRNAVKDDESMLPHLYPVEKEYHLSSIFVDYETPLGRYGTRSTSVLRVKACGEVSFHEQYLENGFWKEQTVTYPIEAMT